MITLYISIGILSIVTIIVFLILRQLNKSIEAFTFMVGKFAEINQDIYDKQRHILKTMSENLEKENRIIIELNTYRRELDRTKSDLDDSAGNMRKLTDDVNTANRKYTNDINTLGSKISKIISDKKKEQ